MTPKRLAINYSAFALIATFANLSSQELFVRAYAGPLNIYAAILIGTLVGLLTKYRLDKQFIFSFQPPTPLDDAKLFLAYSLSGAGTTLIFWATEIGFDYAYNSKIARYLGAVIGLGIGYVVKYQLDKRYVFKRDV